MGCWIHIYVLVTCFYSIDRIHNWEDISSRNRQCHALMMLTTWPCRSLSLQFGSGQWYVAGPYGWFHSQQLSCHVLGIFVSVSIISIIMSQWYELYDIFLLKSSMFWVAHRSPTSKRTGWKQTANTICSDQVPWCCSGFWLYTTLYDYVPNITLR